MNSDKFSLKRMWVVTTHYFVANGRNLAIATFVILALTFLLSVLLTKYGPDDHNGEVRAAILTTFYIMIAALGTTILGSLTFSSYSTKPKRIAAMMLPAKKSEKFLSLILIYIVFGNIVLFGSIILSDIISAGMYGMRSAISYLPEVIFNENPELKPFISLFCLGCLWYFLMPQATYAIGSALWPRLSFLKTFVALSVFQSILVIALPVISVTDISDFISHIIDTYFGSLEAAITSLKCALVVAYMILIAFYGLAWLRFRSLAVSKRFLS